MFRTARWRLVAWNVSVLTLILALLGLAVYGFYRSQIYNSVDQQLSLQRDRIQARLDQANGNLATLYLAYNSPFNPAYRTVMANPQGQVNDSTDCMASLMLMGTCPPDSRHATSADALRDVVRTGRTDLRTVTFRGYPQRVLTYAYIDPATDQVSVIFQTSRLAAGEEASLDELRRLLIFGSLLGILLSGVGSFFLASRALVPIRQAFSRQRQFTADASHELRTPLALIRANAEMLERHGSRLPAGDDELVTEIIRETDHLNRLVGDLLTLARADAETVQIQKQPVDLRALVADVHGDVQYIAESRGISSGLALHGDVVVDGDETRLRQLLLILLDNALKYTDPGGRVDVSLQREDSRATLEVSDTGIGIPVEDIPRVFDRFYRVDRAREHESGGTGLGLAIARWIVQAHGGTIKVDSTLGQGTRFVVEMPVMKVAPRVLPASVA